MDKVFSKRKNMKKMLVISLLTLASIALGQGGNTAASGKNKIVCVEVQPQQIQCSSPTSCVVIKPAVIKCAPRGARI